MFLLKIITRTWIVLNMLLIKRTITRFSTFLSILTNHDYWWTISDSVVLTVNNPDIMAMFNKIFTRNRHVQVRCRKTKYKLLFSIFIMHVPPVKVSFIWLLLFGCKFYNRIYEKMTFLLENNCLKNWFFNQNTFINRSKTSAFIKNIF